MPSAEPPPPDADHQQRLMAGMARAVSAKGYVATTLADIVAAASVSRRTFYEHFDSKASCLIALYESASAEGLRVLQTTLQAGQAWAPQLPAVLDAYLGWMASKPELLHTLFVEILALGAPGLAARRRVHQQLATFVWATARSGCPPCDESDPISPQLALALVGAIHELVLDQLESGRGAHLTDLAPVCCTLVQRLVPEPGAKA